MNVTGTHTAEIGPPGRSRSFEQALSASLVSNTAGLPRRTATQLNGDSTGQPGQPAGLDATRSRWARLESANNSSIGAVALISAIARSTISWASTSSSAI